MTTTADDLLQGGHYSVTAVQFVTQGGQQRRPQYMCTPWRSACGEHRELKYMHIPLRSPGTLHIEVITDNCSTRQWYISEQSAKCSNIFVTSLLPICNCYYYLSINCLATH